VIPVDRALAIVLEAARPLPAEEVALDESLGRVLGEDVHADVDLPPFDRAAMDGYAVRAEDARNVPAVFEVIGQVRAGQLSETAVGSGQAVQIMTGAPVPPGADAVQQVEKTRVLEGGARVELLAAVERGLNVAPRASEVRTGDLVLRAGRAIDPATIATLAAFGRFRVEVGRRPRVAILVTGDELVDAAERPGPGRIRNTNGPALVAQARWAGADVWPLGVVADDAERIAAALVRGFEADVLVVSGGVSAGEYDLVEPAFARFGVEVLFDKVAIKPGAPLVFGRRGETLVFGVPGNPVSAQVTFDAFVRPALLRLQGARCVGRPSLVAELAGPLRNRSGRRAHLPVRLRFAGGRLEAVPLRSQGSADLVAHAGANGLAVLEAERLRAEAGERVPVLLLGNFLDRDGGEDD
jgi:molybdopterin molybdotransferase